MNTKPDISNLDKIGFQDWVLLVVGAIFIMLAPLLIYWGKTNLGITILCLFGMAFAHTIYVIRRKLRHQKQAPRAMQMVGGVPIRPSRLRIAKLGIILLVGGGTLIAFPIDENKIIFWGALLPVALGLLLLIGSITAIPNKNYLQFDSNALTLGRRAGKVLIPWSAIVAIDREELYNQQFVSINVKREAVTSEPAAYLVKLHDQMDASKRSIFGADFTIPSDGYDFDAPDLVATITRYVSSPEARAELGKSNAARA